eukprot:366301-Chlamydomonas_euryale.AAC.36
MRLGPVSSAGSIGDGTMRLSTGPVVDDMGNGWMRLRTGSLVGAWCSCCCGGTSISTSVQPPGEQTCAGWFVRPCAPLTSVRGAVVVAGVGAMFAAAARSALSLVAAANEAVAATIGGNPSTCGTCTCLHASYPDSTPEPVQSCRGVPSSPSWNVASVQKPSRDEAASTRPSGAQARSVTAAKCSPPSSPSKLHVCVY